jgi:hypothetical protein
MTSAVDSGEKRALVDVIFVVPPAFAVSFAVEVAAGSWYLNKK